MSVIDPVARAGLIARVKGILLKPDSEWEAIAAEPATVKGLFTGYAVPLAAIGPVCGAVGMIVFGVGALGFHYRPPIISTLVGALFTFVLGLLAVAVLALVVEGLAPTFDASKDRLNAFKVAIYASTAAWVAGALRVFPPLIPIAGLISLYSLYLLYRGLPKLMKNPPEKTMGYTVVVIVVAIIVQVVVAAVTGAVTAGAMFGAGSMLAHNSTAPTGGTVTVNGQSVDLGKLQAAAEQMKAAANGQTPDGKPIQAVAPDTLKSMLPTSISGFSRTGVDTSSGGMGAIQGARAEAEYARGDSRMTLSLTDMAAAGGLASMASAFKLNETHESADGYEKMGEVGGRMTTEKYDNQSKHGEYTVVVASRFVVSASGDQVSMDKLKGAVSSIDARRLEGMARN